MRKYLLVSLLRIVGRHPILALVLSFVYFLLPFDILPEALAGVVGYAEDLIVLAAVFVLIWRVRKEKPKAMGKVVETTAKIHKDDTEEKK